MTQQTHAAAGWLLNGFQSVIAVGSWMLAVLAYGLFRSFYRSDPDEPRESGPTGT